MWRADLHVHSHHSRGGHSRLPAAGLPPGAADPEAIDLTARRRGMNLVTLTDINSIDGCLELLDRDPGRTDVFISEELTLTDRAAPEGLHVLVYDISEEQHRQLGRLRGDLAELLACGREQGIPMALGPIPDACDVRAVRRWSRDFEIFELRNGSLGRQHNEMVERLVRQAVGERQFGAIGGSGSIGPARVGRTCTVSASLSRAGFLQDLRHGRTWVGGRHGGSWTPVSDLYRMLGRACQALLSGTSVPGERTGRSLLDLTVRLAGPRSLSQGWKSTRRDARIRAVRKRLDRFEVRKFQQKARSYMPASAIGGGEDAASAGERKPSVGHTDRRTASDDRLKIDIRSLDNHRGGVA